MSPNPAKKARRESGPVTGPDTVVVLDYGSQYTQLITRRVRELGVYSCLLPGDVDMVRPARSAARSNRAPRHSLERNAAELCSAREARRAIPDAHGAPGDSPRRLRETPRSALFFRRFAAPALFFRGFFPGSFLALFKRGATGGGARAPRAHLAANISRASHRLRRPHTLHPSPHARPQKRITDQNPSVIILSGGPNSVHVEGAPTVPEGFFDHCQAHSIPVLGICYGMQLLVQRLGGQVEAADKAEYGRMPVHTVNDSLLFKGEPGTSQQVWMSHGDEATRLPEGFACVGKSDAGAVVAIEDPARKLFGLQYHPEVTHSERGFETIKRFLFDIAGLTAGWSMQNVLDEQIAVVKETVGPDAHVICALSGGVDSAVAATLVHRAIGDRLHCCFVDNGLLRFEEQTRVMKMFKDHLHLPVTCIDDSARLLAKLKGVTEPEKKRKTIGAQFIEVFKEYKVDVEKKTGVRPTFLVQGTLYPDVIESCPPPGSDQKHSHTIKSHHNVGGLPKELGFELVEPLRMLFKDEVRKLGLLMDVPKQFISRHPFPGPGLAVRVLGDVCAEGALDTIRAVDEIYINAIREAGLYDQIWQAFAVFLPIKSVGVQGDQRTHSHVVGLRAITSSDGMTADWFQFEPKFLQEVSAKICNQVKNVNRVVYDITSKPPSTVEWE
jgi:GMP synthase (glutamine-hydrolysing)